MTGKHVAIVGATGAVGQDLLAVLAAREFPIASLRLLASARSAGSRLDFGGESIAVQALQADSFAGIDLALFSAGGETSRQFAPLAVAAGAVVVDNSSAFRMDPTVPLIVPEVNPAAIADHRGIIANPNCSTILLVLALAPLHREASLRAVVVSSYQAASGAGRRAMLELRDGVQRSLRGEPQVHEAMPHPLGFNVIPQIDVFQPDGYTREEDKMLYETRKILGLPDLTVDATCVRVPVERCHSESVTVLLERAIDPGRARQLFAAAPGLELEDEPEQRRYPMPLQMAGRDPVAVGRVRRARVLAPGLTFWLCGDQLRKGASLNAVQIAELL
ncbi:MAG: aspartate-semialdehyde dehydrogenase [Planctomycetes bacterium]|nr:aspartate-semialdehyde dehydrogenase [Planctomycetota bacterium]